MFLFAPSSLFTQWSGLSLSTSNVHFACVPHLLFVNRPTYLSAYFQIIVNKQTVFPLLSLLSKITTPSLLIWSITSACLLIVSSSSCSSNHYPHSTSVSHSLRFDFSPWSTVLDCALSFSFCFTSQLHNKLSSLVVLVLRASFVNCLSLCFPSSLFFTLCFEHYDSLPELFASIPSCVFTSFQLCPFLGVRLLCALIAPVSCEPFVSMPPCVFVLSACS